MVDSIKNQTSLSSPQTVPKQASNNSLREGFKNLSSGLSVSEVLKDAPAVVHVQNSRPATQVGKLVSNLQDAVKSSKQTLQSIEDVADQVATSDGPAIVQALAEDLTQLKSDIVDLLQDLQKKAGAAEVASENMEAATAKIEDVEKARAKAQSMESSISDDPETALGAHKPLSFDVVRRLLGAEGTPTAE